MTNRDAINKQFYLTKVLLYGYILNLFFGMLVFVLVYIQTDESIISASLATIMAMLIGSVLATVFISRIIMQRINQFEAELGDLNDKVNQSTSVLSVAQQDNQAFADSIPASVIILSHDLRSVRLNKAASTYLDMLSSSHKLTPDDVLKSLNTFKVNGKPIDITEWISQAQSSKIVDAKRWAFCVSEAGEKTKACDIIARYNKNDSYNRDVVILIADRTPDYDRQERQMEFISLAAHELRGPITILRGLIEVLQAEIGDTLSSDHNELIQRLGVSARQLAGYVDNILNASRVDQDTFAVHIAERNWKEILLHALSDLEIRAKAHHRSLDIQIPDNLPAVAVDTTSIFHVVNNLVDNAIKYSREDGVVTIKVSLQDDIIETLIRDTGIGIPASVVNNLFTKFYRSHRSKHTVGGTGLGLYLCKSIVESHGGNIWVRSSEGVGTTFGFTLPTYASVAQNLKNKDDEEKGIVRSGHGWIKNHSMYRR